MPSYSEAIFNSMKAERTVTRIAFNPGTANPGDVLYIMVPKLIFDIGSNWQACEQLFGV